MKTPPVIITIQPPTSASPSSNHDHSQSFELRGSSKSKPTAVDGDLQTTTTSAQLNNEDLQQNEHDEQDERHLLAATWDPSQYHVQMLRAKFIGLINYKKFRLVYMLSLCYILLNLLLIGSLVYQSEETRTGNRPGQVVDCLAKIISQAHENVADDDYDDFFVANDNKTNLVNDNLMSALKNSPNNKSTIYWIVSLSIMLLLIIIQTPLVLMTNREYFIQLSIDQLRLQTRRRQKSKQNNDEQHLKKAPRKPLARELGLLISLLLLHLQVQSVTLVTFFMGDNQNTVPWLVVGPRLAANLFLAYLTPMIVDSGSPLLNALALTLLAPSTCVGLASWLWLRIYATSSDLPNAIENQVLALVLLTPLLWFCGWFQRNRGKRSICDQIFADANKLIEAKVSLEAQRQQQETLLLSVLPAYVAEQVKRNMLRQVEQTHSQCQANQHTNNNTQYQSSSSPSSSQLQSVVSVKESSPGSGSGQAVTELASGNLNLVLSSQSTATSSPSTNNSNVERPSGYLGRRKSSFSEHGLTRKSAGHKKVARSSSIQASGQASVLPPSSGDQSSKTSPSQPQTPAIMMSLGPSSASRHQSSTGATSYLMAPPPSSPARRGFNELFIRTYNNVSLLYADIVGFTHLCTKLSASHLVRVLNNLFSQFDHLADQHKIMRIKILGDCYYGVSGIPEFAVLGAKSRISHRNYENHAINCVNMGLDMIDYIGCLNRELASNRADQLLLQARNDDKNYNQPDEEPASSSTSLAMEQIELNMRIGIHSGHIHSGVIGLKKWQFDVWSNDVSIAMHCESSGTSGRVQVTDATIAHLKEAFVFEPSNAGNVDPFLDGQHIRTYFIIERKQRSNSVSGGHRPYRPSKRAQLSLSRAHLRDNDLDKKIRTATINTIHQTLLSVDCFTTTDALPPSNNNNSTNQATSGSAQINQKPELNYHNMTGFGLEFKDANMRRLYASRRIQGLGYELFSLWVVLAIVVPATNWLLKDANNMSTTTSTFIPSQHIPISQSLCTTLSLLLIHIRALVGQLPSWLWCCCSKSSSSSASSSSTMDHHNRNQLASMVRSLLVCGRDLSSSSSRSKNKKNQGCAGQTTTNGSSISLTRQRLTAGLILLLLVLECTRVLLIQDCKQQPTKLNFLAQSLQLQQFQVALLLFLVAINAASRLIGYPLHSALLLLLALLSLLTLPFRNYNLFALLLADDGGAAGGDCKNCYYYYLKYNTNESYSWLLLDWLTAFLLVIALIWSWLWVRQVEFASKADFLWRNQLSVDHEELEYISGINKILLENILPSHVVQYYLNQQQPPSTPMDGGPSPMVISGQQNSKQTSKSQSRDPQQQPAFMFGGRNEAEQSLRMSFTSIRNLSSKHELYHESHDGVAVMFASIPHFYEFYDESDVSKQGLGCIALLNEIICEFDKLLLKNKFSRIEKIKTIGSTYMAVAGLRPGHWKSSSRNSNASQSTMIASECGSMIEGDIGGDSLGKFLLSQQKQNLLSMVQFAMNLMQALNNINKQSFQAFKLRVGLNSGSVIAGVIGTQRPFYDIWGDTVNIASRMESLGHVGRIQVTDPTAQLLLETTGVDNAYRIIKRGTIQVKGKGGMVTYFVDKHDKS